MAHWVCLWMGPGDLSRGGGGFSAVDGLVVVRMRSMGELQLVQFSGGSSRDQIRRGTLVERTVGWC